METVRNKTLFRLFQTGKVLERREAGEASKAPPFSNLDGLSIAQDLWGDNHPAG